VQVKLLRAIQEGEVDPVGGTKPIKVDIRLISATNKNLQQLVAEEKFREDLYYRLNVFPLGLPPLRERREDIPELIAYFIHRFAAEEGKPVRGIEDSAQEMLSDYRWPGNVRQLENAVYRAVVLSDRELLTLHDFPQIVGLSSYGSESVAPGATVDGEGLHGSGAPGGFSPFTQDSHLRTLADVEGDMIRLAIHKYQNHMSEIARRLGIGRSTLYRKVRELGLDVRDAG
jgi:DNA-binding NtrC family response regulator